MSVVIALDKGVRMAVELLEDKKRWDQFVETSPQGLLFHKWDFLKIVERHSKYRFLPYGVYSGEELRCIFPFFVGRDRGLTVMCSPPPRAHISYLGFAFDPSVQAFTAHKREKILDQVTSELCREIDKIAPNFVSFTTVPNFLDVRFFTWNNFTAHIGFASVIDLEKSLDEIWASFSRRCRRGIERVSAYSPEIQQTNDVGPMLDIFRPRFSELGVPVPLFSDSYLKELMATFPEHLTVFSTNIDGRLTEATVCCVLQKERYCYWIGNVNARKDLNVSDYLIWEVIRRAKSEGFKKLDLGTSDPRIFRYKVRFDPVFEPCYDVERRDMQRKISDFVYNKLRAARARLRS